VNTLGSLCHTEVTTECPQYIMNVTIAKTKKDFLQAIFLRRKVLVREFKFSSYRDEPDMYDLSARIYIVKEAGKVIATVRVRKDGNVYRIQRVAIDSVFRKKGVGTSLLKQVLNDYKQLYVMAPKDTVDFYERFGFKKSGKTQKGKIHIYYRMQNY